MKAVRTWARASASEVVCNDKVRNFLASTRASCRGITDDQLGFDR